MTNDTYARTPAMGDVVVAPHESSASGVSWAAIVAGAVGAASMALILMTLGVGLGFLAVSPYDDPEAAFATAGIGAIVWSIVVHAASFGLGGYLAGRLRTKWANIHGDEVYFRDTAHGFVSWALAILLTTAMLICLAGAFARGTVEFAGKAAGTGIAGAAIAGGQLASDDTGSEGGVTDYFTDMFFRPGDTAAAGSTATDATGTTGAPMSPAITMAAQPTDAQRARSRNEAGRILVTSIANGEASAGDKAYLAQLVSVQTGMTQEQAAQRVDEVIGQAQAAIDAAKEEARQAADAARKAAAGAALWAFVALLIGAFSASYAATLGGRARDL